MKIAVYTVALNEEQFVERWYESAKDADFLLILDTGSSDNTRGLANSLGITVVNVAVSPWRFDDARNAALVHLPSDMDYCVALDMDEILVEGWREELEKATADRPRYEYTWSWNPDGSAGLVYGGDKIHKRKGYRWKHPVHEVLNKYDGAETQEWLDLKIHHHPDATKSRSQYLPLLEMAVNEDPHDDRNAYYFARELYFNGQYERAADEFRRHLSLPRAIWKPERSASYRYLAKCESKNKEHWLLLARNESFRKENYVALAEYYYDTQQWEKCLEEAEKAIKITDKPLDYLCEAFAWGSAPYDYAAIASYNLGLKERALSYGELACEVAPYDERLKNNLVWYQMDKQ